ncbi:hypothetical protein JKY72_07000 [Candidatus Gracilibacteria bacterium]|nr:hypothetical protein [Candidatus Gracilibacteria bacterium]
MNKYKKFLQVVFALSCFSLSAAQKNDENVDSNAVIRHEHHHVHEHKNGSSFEEVVVSAKNNLLPGAVKGFAEGLALAGGELKKIDGKYAPVVADALEGVASASMDALRENSDELTEREAGYAPFFGEKIVHNMVKYLVGLYLLDFDKNISKKDKVAFVQKYVNSSARGQDVLGTGLLRGGWNFLIRTFTEGATAHDETLEFQWEKGVAGASGALVTEALTKYALFRKCNARKVKRLTRFMSPVVGSIFKVLLPTLLQKSGQKLSTSTEVTKFDGLFTQYLLSSKSMLITSVFLSVAAGATAHPVGERFLNNFKSLLKVFNLVKDVATPSIKISHR